MIHRPWPAVRSLRFRRRLSDPGRTLHTAFRAVGAGRIPGRLGGLAMSWSGPHRSAAPCLFPVIIFSSDRRTGRDRSGAPPVNGRRDRRRDRQRRRSPSTAVPVEGLAAHRRWRDPATAIRYPSPDETPPPRPPVTVSDRIHSHCPRELSYGGSYGGLSMEGSRTEGWITPPPR